MSLVALIYGVNYFTLKAVFDEDYNNFAILALRSMVGAAFFFGFHALFVREKIRSRKDYGRLFLCAMFGISINQTFFLWGLANTTKVNSSVLMVTTPVFVFLVAWLMKQEMITLRKLAGLILSLAGALALILFGKADQVSLGGETITGDVMIMVNAASYGIYLVLVRSLVLKYNTFTIVKWLFLFGAIPNISIGIVPLMETDFSGASTTVWVGIVFLILFATLIVYFLNAWSMKKVPSSAVGIYIYFQPVFVTLLSMILGQGEVSPVKFPFILLIFAGVYLVTSKASNKKPEKTTP